MTLVEVILLLARILTGEGPQCNPQELQMLAHVALNRQALGWIDRLDEGWIAVAERPTNEAVLAAIRATHEPDTTHGAVYALGRADHDRRFAQRFGFLKDYGTIRLECGGDWVVLYYPPPPVR